MAIEHTFKWRDGQRTENLSPLRAIRMKCYDCMGREVGVERLIKECEIRDCALWPFRLGRDPSKHISARRLEVARKNLEAARKRVEDLSQKGPPLPERPE